MASFILASSSPRRRDLLKNLGLTFDVQPADLDETPLAGEVPSLYVQRLAREKAEAVAARFPGAFVLAADTTVALGADILGKPHDAADALRMLTRLSGTSHEVFTGVALAGPSRSAEVRVSRTEVTFRPATEAELRWYISTGEPLDRAGSYAMQGQGGFLVESLTGSPTNVIGLPLAETLALLSAAGLPLAWRRG